jgi:hypothetical protein
MICENILQSLLSPPLRGTPTYLHREPKFGTEKIMYLIKNTCRTRNIERKANLS